MYDLIPGVSKFLSDQDAVHSERFLEYLKLLSSEEFPISNICYNVFRDLILWHTLSDKRRMRYTPEVKRFWHIGKILFHTKFLEFMRGSCDIDDESEEKNINFPVPYNTENKDSKIPEKKYNQVSFTSSPIYTVEVA